MRKPKLQANADEQGTSYTVSKKDFELKAVEVLIHNETEGEKEVKVITKDRYNEWSFRLSKEELASGVPLIIKDATCRATLFRIQ